LFISECKITLFPHKYHFTVHKTAKHYAQKCRFCARNPIFKIKPNYISLLLRCQDGADTAAIVCQLLAEYDVSPQEAEAGVNMSNHSSEFVESPE
jgi:hypothetical protein